MKAGRILLLLAVFFTVTGASNTTFAQDYPSYPGTCSSSLVSTATCANNGVQVCLKPTPELPMEVQSAVITLAPEAPNSTPTQTPTTPQPTINPTTTPAPMPALRGQMASDAAALDSDKIFSLINQYRESQGLTPFEKNDDVCSLAQTRSTEIPAEINNGTLHSGLYNRGLPYWIWENAKYGSNEDGTVAWWLASPLHHKSIVGDYKYSCVKCTGSYCSELFTSFSPK